MPPGWYWIVLDRKYQGDSAGSWGAFQRQNPTLKARTVEGEWMLLEVTGDQALVWTLPGFPTKAPKGAATTRADTETAPAVLPDATGPDGSIEQWLASMSLAGKVLLWGGVGVVLVVMYQQLREGARAKQLPATHDETPPPSIPPSIPPSRGPSLKSAKSTWTSRYR